MIDISAYLTRDKAGDSSPGLSLLAFREPSAIAVCRAPDFRAISSCSQRVASDVRQSAMGYVALGILKAAIFAAIGRGFVQAFGLDSRVARMINSARANTPSWLAWIMAGSFSLLCVAAWEIFHVDDHLRNAITWPWEKVAIEGRIFQSGVAVGDAVGGRRSPTDVTVFEFTEITHAQGLNRGEPIEYLGIKMKIFRIDSGAGTMLTRPQDGTIYIGVFAKVLSTEKGNH